MKKEKKEGREVKAGIGIFNIQKSTAYPKSSGDKKTLSGRQLDGSMGSRCTRRKVSETFDVNVEIAQNHSHASHH